MASHSDLDGKVLGALEKAGPLTTGGLADALGVDKGRVYRCCRSLEESGRLESGVGQNVDILLLFCKECLAVVVGEDLENCKEMGHELGAFHPKVREWSLPQIQIARQ